MSEHGPSELCAMAMALGLALGSAHAAAQDQSSWRWSGDFKNLLLQSRTSPGDRYVLDRNRLRLALKGSISEVATVDLQYDNDLLLGRFVDTAEFRQQRDLAPRPYWSLQSDYVDRSSMLGRQGLYRASVNFRLGQTDIRIGRQRIAWGTGRFWSPLDLLNPVTPIALDRTERLGVDAVLVEHRTGALSRVAAVYAPEHEGRADTRALLWHDNAAGVDYSVVVGQFRRERVLGADLTAQVGQALVRAELTRVHPLSGASFERAMLGLDYAFANTLTLSAEIYIDCSGATDRARYDLMALASGQRQNLARAYFGLRATYDVTPLLKWTTELVVNTVDRSRYVSPAITWAMRPDLDWTFGVQHFSGPAGSELERLRNTTYVQMQWFF